MASFAELARARTVLDAAAIDHLQRLLGAWSLLADLSFSDLLLYGATDPDGSSFVVLGHTRSATGTTVHLGDPVGEEVRATDRPLLARALLERRRAESLIVRRGGKVAPGSNDPLVEEDVRLHGVGGRITVDYIPVVADGQVIAVMTREAEPALLRHPSPLERRYRDVGERIATMVADGTFPLAHSERVGEFREPRVGDGVVILDREGRAEYASPNAVSALRRLGVMATVDGKHLRDMGVDDAVVRRAFSSRHSTVEELEGADDMFVVVRCHPLLANGRATGAIAVMRDISEIRSRDRLLVSKDATIREIHHRVKNNLQTIQSLLRLQSRRLSSPEAVAAIEQSARRIGSIAVVHETLSADAADVVDFDAVMARLVAMTEDALGSPDRPVRVVVEGSLGELSGDVAMPLAIVVTELLQNAVDHSGEAGGDVTVRLGAPSGDKKELVLTVEDRGPGVPDGFSLDRDAGLGLTLVRTFVVHDLGGSISIGRARREAPSGTVVSVRVPRPSGGLPMG